MGADQTATASAPSRPAEPVVVATIPASSTAQHGAAPEPTASPLWRTTAEARSHLLAQNAEVLGRAVNLSGRVAAGDSPIEGAQINIGNAGTTTARDGTFTFAGLERRNATIEVHADGYLLHRQAVTLEVDRSTASVDLGTMQLDMATAERVRLAFGGDVALGRRYLDPGGTAERNEVPNPDPNALIRAPTAHADTESVLAMVGEMFEPYDFVSVNLESVVTTDPAEPWEERNYVIFSLPESVAALGDGGVDHVSLGNNHIWDYGERGVVDTLGHLDRLGLAHSGAGIEPRAALAPHVTQLSADLTLALHSFVAIEGVTVTNRTAARPGRGGAADLNDGPNVRAALEASDGAGHLTVALPHTGYEYTEQPPPDNYTTRKLQALVDLGADLVVANHPHIPQGFEFHDDRLIAYSLGNLAFDQLRLDTVQAFVLVTTFDDHDLMQARLVPLLLDDFIPRWGVGASVDLLLRRLSLLSAGDVVLVAENGGARISRRRDAKRTVRTIDVPLDVDPTGTAYIDLRPLRQPNESLGAVHTRESTSLSYGRDLMIFGDMEDPDTDAANGETPFWSLGEATVRCAGEALRGTGALCSLRDASNTGPASVSFTRRIRVLGDRTNAPNKDVTLVLYAAGDNRGEVTIEAAFRASQGVTDFGTRVVAELPAGTSPWRAHWVPLPIPPDDPTTLSTITDHPLDPAPGFANARALRVAFRHHPPDGGVAVSKLDDIAVVSWERPTAITPNPFDFIRVTNARRGELVSIDLVSYR